MFHVEHWTTYNAWPHTFTTWDVIKMNPKPAHQRVLNAEMRDYLKELSSGRDKSRRQQ
jgi:hypothetical protein